MNIGIMISSLGAGGAEKVAKILSDYLQNQGHKVFCLLPATNVKKQYSLSGETVFLGELKIRDNQGRVAYFEDLYREARKVKRIKKKLNLDATISFMEKSNAINSLSKADDKVILSVHTVLSVRNDFTGQFYNMENIHYLYSKADKIITLSEDGCREMTEYYSIPPEKVKLLPNPIVDYLFNDEYDKWEYGDKCIITVARLDSVKQQNHLIKAFSEVVKHENRAKLILCGKGELDDYLRGLARKYRIERNVKFTGFTTNVPNFLKNAKAFVLTSKCEGFPLSMVEAMQYGVPVIMSDKPGGGNDILQSGSTIKDGALSESDEIHECIKAGIHFTNYGIVTPKLSGFNMYSELDDAEMALAKAMLCCIKDTNVYNYYSQKSLERAKYYDADRVLSEWEKVIVS